MSVGIDPNTVDWSDVFRCIGMDPGEPITGQTKLITAITLSDQVSIEDEEEAAEFITDALEHDGLSRTARGYVIDEFGIDDETVEEKGDAGGDPNDKTGSVKNDEIADLRKEIEELRSQNKRQEAVNRRQDQLIKLLLGDTDLSVIEPGEMRPILDRLQAIEERIIEVEDENEQRMALAEQSFSKPDKRGQKLRQSLLDHAGTDGHSALKRDDVDAILGGIHRGSVLDAMKRAADGRLASGSDRQYSPITGSSELSPVDAITFEVAKDQDTQSRLVLDADDLTGIETRQNVMTGGEG